MESAIFVLKANIKDYLITYYHEQKTLCYRIRPGWY